MIRELREYVEAESGRTIDQQEAGQPSQAGAMAELDRASRRDSVEKESS